MKSEFQPRPQSKSKANFRPTSKYVNSEQATETFKKAKIQQQSSNYQKAIELYMRSTMYDPNYFQAYCNAGSCYRYIGKYLQARSMYLKSISIKKDDAISHYNLANIERVIANYETAINHYQFVIALKEKMQVNVGSLYLDSLVNLGICYKNTEQLEKAAEIFAKASLVDPNDEVCVYDHAMTLMKIIQKLDCQIYHELAKEKTAKAEELFKKLLLINPNSEVSKLQLIKLPTLLDKSQKNLKQAVSKLQELLKNQKLLIKDQVTEQLAIFLKQLKQFQASANYFQKSLTHFNQRKNSTKVIEPNIYDQANAYTNQPIDRQITEEQGVRMVQAGDLDEARKYIQKMQDNQAKRVIQIAIELEQAQKSKSNLKSAVEMYNKYFCENKKQLPFDKISIEGHKVIGKLLSMQGKFDESIKHFEYISQKLQSNTEKSKVHSSLASDYQAKGDKENALREYRIALQQQPQNYEMMYNVGCCLNDAGHNTESLVYFNQYLEKINSEDNIQVDTKKWYIADCLVTMSLCSLNTPNQFQTFNKASNSLREVQELEAEQGFQFEDERILHFYQRWAELLQDRISGLSDKKSQDFIRNTQKLLEAYINMLSNENCPDRDAVLSNTAIIFYEQRLFINSLANANQITNEKFFESSNLALIYLHLGEYWMAYKSISNSTETEDIVVKFNVQVFNWIYGNATEGRLLQKYPNQSEKQQISRWQYALVLIDYVTKKIDECQDKENSMIKQVIEKALGDDIILSDETQRIKLAVLIKELKKTQGTTRDSAMDSDIIKLCITKSEDVPSNFNLLLKKLSNYKQHSQMIILTAINLFIFTNIEKASLILPIIKQLTHQKKEIVHLQLDKRVTLTQDLITRQLKFSSLDDIVINFSNWQCDIESKLVTLIKVIEKYYYHSKIKHPLQLKYNFPRHAQYDQCSQTLAKILTIINNTLKVETKFEFNGKSLPQLKKDIIKQTGKAFQLFMKKSPIIKISLGQRLSPTTLEGSFQNKEGALQFIKSLQKQCNDKKDIQVGRNVDKIVVVISGFITMNLTWKQQNDALTNILRDLSNSPIDLYVQSIINLESTLEILKQSSNTTKQLLQTIPVFKY